MSNHFLEENIFIDLHIHSFSSYYKDGDVVNNSTIENVDVLIKALEAKHINMFAITDHNRFDFDLYCELKKKIVDNPILKCVLPGIEFDVLLEEGHPSAHIVAIFDDGDQDKIKAISSKIKEIGELDKEGAYSVDDFERLLRKIGVKTILIVHQKQALDNKRVGTHSLSEACENPSYFMKTGFIDSLEFSTNRHEGIVKASLRDYKLSFPLITGSDCHDWSAYPYRDNITIKIERRFTSLRCLPSFKGLLMSITSFETRANRAANINKNFIKTIKIGQNEYPLANGINAIIGDNGSGKSLLLNLICSGKKTCYRDIVKHNELSFQYNTEAFSKESILYIEQGQINREVIDGRLFGGHSDYYSPIPTLTTFSNQIFSYFEKLNDYTCSNIRLFDRKNEFERETIIIEAVDRNFVYPVIETVIDLEDTKNEKERATKLESHVEGLKQEFINNLEYYDSLGLERVFREAISKLETVLSVVKTRLSKKEKRNSVKGIISSKLRECSVKLSTKRTSEEENNNRIISSYIGFKNKLISLLKAERAENVFPTFPDPLEGKSANTKGGFVFAKKAKYDGLSLKDDFYKHCFNSGYNDEDTFKNINTKDMYKEALKGCSSLDELKKYKENKVGGFIKEWSSETTFVSEDLTSISVGNTPGENALVFYKYTISERNDDFCVLAIDQPEDDINPKRINDFLLDYLGSIRDKKQIIIVTHNPLLVVNLDVDNVVYLKKENKNISIKYGALEYDDEYNILDFVKENLDGGYNAIEGRLKKYEKDNDNN